ncbi:MAG: ABC transporter permease [Chloroflexi bacterium]|nr:ABC transporter permease [Chloroflexota bacterium]
MTTSTPGMGAAPVLSAAERRARSNGLIRAAIYAVVGVLALGAGLFRLPASQTTTYRLVFDNAAIRLPDLTVPVGGTYAVAGVICLAVAAFQLLRPANLAWRRQLAIVAFTLIAAVLTGILGGKTPSLVGLIAAMVSFALPIVFAGLAAIFAERSGVFNIGIEGIILLGASATAVGGSILHSPYGGILIGVFAGLLLGLLLAVLSIRYRVDQIIAGTVLNLAAAGITTFMYTRILQVKPEFNAPGLVGTTPIPGLSEIPIIGPALFNGSIFLYVGYALIILMQLAIYRTRWGLRLRAAGENPNAAGTIGIDVLQIRYRSLAASGAVAGLGGAYLVVVSTGSFQIGMSAGIGFIGIAAMIFGGWKPVGVAMAALVFGFARSAESRLGTVGVDVPTVFLSILPYVVTIIVVAGLVGRVRVPAAAGQPYEQA